MMFSHAQLSNWFNKLCRLLYSCAFLLLTVLYTMALADYLPQWVKRSGFGFLTDILIISLTWFTVVLIHEGGHYLAAIRNRMIVIEIRVLWLVMKGKRKGFSWSLERVRPGAGGLVRAIPDPGASIPKQMVRLALGGPVMNLMFSIFGAIATWVLYQTELHFPYAIMLFFTLFNLSAGLFNLLPIGKRYPSDGSTFYAWSFKKESQKNTEAVLRLNGLSYKGLRTSDMPLAELHELTSDADAKVKLIGHYLLIRNAMDGGVPAKAAEMIQDSRGIYAELPDDKKKALAELWQYFLLEEAYLKARYERSPGAAAELLASTAKPPSAVYARLRMEAAARYAESRWSEAKGCLEKARHELAETLDEGARIEETMLLDDLSAAIDSAQTA